MTQNLGSTQELKMVDNAWGTETFLQWSSDAVVKVLFFYPNATTPYCYHLHRSKSLYIGYGKFVLRCVNPKTGILIEKVLTPGFQYKIDPGIAHQIQLLDKEGHIIETSKPYQSDDLYLLADTILYSAKKQQTHMDDTSRPSLR